ncbi:MAG: hypothetical protein M0D55_09015 [Elusimicrobiota bacterium]|nr:MAG: hypothetical protein M0D55_09015 [Elusimicrobiota bacterium]
MSRPLAALLAALTLTSPAAAAECSLNAFSPAGVKAECATASSDGVARCGAYQDAVISACRALADEASAVMKPLVGKKRSPDEEKTYQEASTRYDISWSVFMDAQMRGQSATGPEYDAYREYNETAPGFVALQKIKPLNELEFNPPSPAGTPGAVTPPQKAVDLVEKTALGGPKPDFAKAGKVAEQHLAAGSPADAERVAKLAVERKPDDARGPAVLAETALTRDDPSEAARWAKRALALDPTNKRAKDALAFAEAVLAKSRLKGPGARPGFEEKEAPDTGAAGGVARVPAGSVPRSAPRRRAPADPLRSRSPGRRTSSSPTARRSSATTRARSRT